MDTLALQGARVDAGCCRLSPPALRRIAARLNYRWHPRMVMAERSMFATIDLIEPLAWRGIRLSYRLVVERPWRLGLRF
jgi:hypothetical protein